MAVANLLGYALNLVASRAARARPASARWARCSGLVLIGNVAALGLQTVTARVLAGDPGPCGAEASAPVPARPGSALGRRPLTLAAAPVLAALLHLSAAGRSGGCRWCLRR